MPEVVSDGRIEVPRRVIHGRPPDGAPSIAGWLAAGGG